MPLPNALPTSRDALCDLIASYLDSKAHLESTAMKLGYLTSLVAGMVQLKSTSGVLAELSAFVASQAKPNLSIVKPPQKFAFNPQSRRYAIGSRDLHCGDCFQLCLAGTWLPVRIEMSQEDWYLVGMNPSLAESYEGMEARFA